MTAGCAAATGIYILGPRAGRYAPDGKPIPFPGSNIPMAALGLWLVLTGWPGLAGLQGLNAMAHGFMTLLLGGAAGCIGAYIYASYRFKKPDVTIVINGTVAGLVSVSGAADMFSPIMAALVGAAGGVLCAYIIPRLDKYRFDDPIGIVPVHLAGGIWGTLIAGIHANIFSQIAGLVITLGFAGLISAGGWIVLRRVLGLRCSARAERHGLDMEAVGLEAYPDFPIRTAGRPDITQIDKY
jgi:Amt family ammonium transporter